MYTQPTAYTAPVGGATAYQTTPTQPSGYTYQAPTIDGNNANQYGQAPPPTNSSQPVGYGQGGGTNQSTNTPPVPPNVYGQQPPIAGAVAPPPTGYPPQVMSSILYLHSHATCIYMYLSMYMYLLVC